MMSPKEIPIIECEHVTFRYNGEKVLSNVSFSVKAGDSVGMVGANGSGKTTLLKVLLGLLTPEEGVVKLFGTPLSEFREWQKIGYVPQNVFRGDMNFPATVREIVESGHTNATFGSWCQFGGEKCAPVEKALRRTDILSLANKRIGELSGGERQRVFIARALVSEPALLVLDEPTTGIDAESEENFYAFLEELNRSGITIILVSHDLEAVARQMKTVLCLNRRLVCFGDPSHLQSAGVLKALYGEKQILHHEHHHEEL